MQRLMCGIRSTSFTPKTRNETKQMGGRWPPFFYGPSSPVLLIGHRKACAQPRLLGDISRTDCASPIIHINPRNRS
jgi:hypothetical protein